MTDFIAEHDKLETSHKVLVGLYQEARLAQDDTGGEDGMWFDEAVSKVMEDVDTTVKWVVDSWPHGYVSVSAIRNHCGMI